MSGHDEHFLARWSRRKQAVRETETTIPAIVDKAAAQGEGVSETAADALPPEAAEATGATEAPEAAEAAEALPKVEDLTAESDLSAFLRKGVPATLKSAALRKMWSLDPNIRDFVGLSENAWDFNDPESIPGFGVITDSPRALLAQLVSQSSPAATEPPAPAQIAEAGQDEPPSAEADAPPPPKEDGKADDPRPPQPADSVADDERTTPGGRHGRAIPT